MRPGKAEGLPPGESITPRTLLRYMQDTYRAMHPKDVHVPTSFRPGDDGYIPFYIDDSESVRIPGGWKKQNMLEAVASGHRYHGENNAKGIGCGLPFGTREVNDLAAAAYHKMSEKVQVLKHVGDALNDLTRLARHKIATAKT